VFLGRTGRLVVGLLLLEMLVAVEALVTATIAPAILRDFDNLRLFGWLGPAYTLATFGTIPLAGRAADRYGVRAMLVITLPIYVAGLALAFVAPNMEILIAARFVQGLGSGGMYAVSVGAIAKNFPERLRPRILALLASMWVLPGVLGPPFGALMASTIGWRYAFVAPLPILLLGAWLVLPAIGAVTVQPEERARLPVLWALLLMLGTAAFLGGLSTLSPWSIPVILAGGALTVAALRRIVPEGTLSARPGIPAAAAAAFLLSGAFFATDYFVTTFLTEIRGLSIGVAGLIVTAATVTWSAGSWWQSRIATRVTVPTIVRRGALLVVVGIGGVALGLVPEIPALVIYLGWFVAGLGMGMAFPSIPLAVMSEATAGEEASELSSVLLMDTLGITVGGGLGAASIAIADRLEAGLEPGLMGAFLTSLVFGLALLAIVGRLPLGPARTAGGSPGGGSH
jgi:MFS family permease